MGRRITAVAGAAAVALVLAGCGQTESDGLPRLPVGPASAATAEAAGGADAAASSDGTRGMSMPAFEVEYRLDAPLPELADSAPAYELSTKVDGDAVERLARALGLTGGAERMDDSGGWTVVDGGRRLSASAFGGGSWWFGSDAGVVSSGCAEPDKASGAQTPSDTGCAPTPPISDLPAEAEAVRIARSLFARAGIDVDAARVTVEQDPFQGWRLAFQPVVGGLPVVGLEHSVAIGAKGAVTWASGFLSTPESIGDYPLVGTAKGFQRLTEGFGGGYGGGPAPLTAGDEPAIAEDPDCDSPTVKCAPPPAPGTEPAIARDADRGSPTVVCDPPLPEGGPEVSEDPGSRSSTVACEPPPPGGEPEPVVQPVTGVELVLMLVSGMCAGEVDHLVPAYRFAVGDGGHAGPVPAVEDSKLDLGAGQGGKPGMERCHEVDGGDPVPSPDRPVSGGGSGSGGGVVDPGAPPPDAGGAGQIGPARPPGAEVVEPQPAPAPGG